MQSIGLETLPLRIDVSCLNALKIAKFLENERRVKSVNYPGLETSKFFRICQKQFGTRPGGLLTFDLDSKEECFRFMNKLKIIRRATRAKALFDWLYLQKLSHPSAELSSDLRINWDRLTFADINEFGGYVSLSQSAKMSRILKIIQKIYVHR